MRVLVCPNAFKGSLTAHHAATIITHAVYTVWPTAEVISLPLADGGDGTLETLLAAVGGQRYEAQVPDPLGRLCTASYGILTTGTAVIELAQASGLALLSPQERDPGQTSTLGTGYLLRQAIDQGCQDILLTLGGSATNDGGTGIARALGFRFVDAEGQELPLGGAALGRLATIDASQVDPRYRQVRYRIACDVHNPLLGPLGATAVYAPQKGATPEQMPILEEGLTQLAAVLRQTFSIDVASLPGAGAAGGAGGGLVAMLAGTLESGTDLILETVGLNAHIAQVDLIITGEGQLDGQSQMGKLFSGLYAATQREQKPLLVVVGHCQGSLDLPGVRVVELCSLAPDQASAMREAARYLHLLTVQTLTDSARWITQLSHSPDT